eukprot:NODE_586_length_5672_cov_0.462229.p2 type:complete len:371 gc:universal NODE_586_length_5672_cov_0.462229:2128-1016(-)
MLLQPIFANFDWVSRPQSYWGLRTKEPDGLIAGLMWWNASNPNIRHVCDNNYEHSYYYDIHDGENYSKEIINDLGLKLTVEWVRTGHEWVAKIQGKTTSQDSPTGLAFYIGTDSKNGFINQEDNAEFFSFTGYHNNKDFGLHIESDAKMIKHSGFKVDSGKVWMAEQYFTNKVREYQNLYFESSFEENSNLAIFRQLSAGDFELKIAFTEKGVKGAKKLAKAFSERSSALVEQFNENFERNFDVSTNKITKKKGNKLFSSEYLNYSRIAIASTIGGIGYFSGNYILDKTPLIEDDFDPYDSQFADYFDNDDSLSPEKNKLGHRRDSENPEFSDMKELYSSTPSRSFFPRGFIWDEGFHLLMIGKFNENIG